MTAPEIEFEYEIVGGDGKRRKAITTQYGFTKLPLKTIINGKKNILGKERCVYMKYGSKKEYVKYKEELILIKDFIKYYSSKPTTKPTTKPATKPIAKPTTKPAAKPATKPTTKPTTKPITKPTTKPTTKPVTKPTTKPTTKPATKPVTKPATKPVTKPTTKPKAISYNTKELKEIAKKNNIKVTKKIEDKYVTLNKKELISKLKRKKLI
jgi:hypothetical protein